jgi:hypothetical protein
MLFPCYFELNIFENSRLCEEIMPVWGCLPFWMRCPGAYFTPCLINSLSVAVSMFFGQKGNLCDIKEVVDQGSSPGITPGRVTSCGCQSSSCNQVFLMVFQRRATTIPADGLELNGRM